jgi:hypothetical protein
VFGTLLGPEGTRAVRSGWLDDAVLGSPQCPRATVAVIPQAEVRMVWLVLSGAVVFGWLFENCTVDASIFVNKLLRAHGGCLGIRSR